MLCNVWVVSVLFLLLSIGMYPTELSGMDIIRYLFPTYFSNNWYTSCYILFLFIYPFINKLISVISQKEHLRITIFSTIIWIIMNYISEGHFYESRLVVWIAMYFLISYLKIYCPKMMKNKRVGVRLLVVGIAGYISQVVVTNYVGLYLIRAFSNRIFMWSKNSSPFCIMIALGGLILSLQAKFKSRIVNYISSVSMLIYLVHESILFRTRTRLEIWQYIYAKVGFSRVVLSDLIFTIVFFLISIIISLIYKETIQRIVVKVSDRLYYIISEVCKKIELKMLNGMNSNNISK